MKSLHMEKKRLKSKQNIDAPCRHGSGINIDGELE